MAVLRKQNADYKQKLVCYRRLVASGKHIEIEDNDRSLTVPNSARNESAVEDID